MELKRYVLLENKTIINNRWGLWLRDSDNMVIDGVDKPHKIGVMIKTSDNILDFVEMADLIEVDYLNGILDSRGNEIRVHKVYFVQLVTRDVSDNTHIVIDMKEDGNIDVKKDYIVSIYKRQPNGDYKRYEVLS